MPTYAVSREGPKFRKIDSKIGYVDLDRLVPAEVNAMFDALSGLDAIIFDMRGYPHGTMWSIAPCINRKGAHVAAQMLEPVVEPIPPWAAPSIKSTPLTIAPCERQIYAGKTVMLVDERTQSQSEGTALAFEAASGTTFIGSQTAGTNGDLTGIRLPAKLGITFTGHDIRHADGRQLQRIGIIPDVLVRPTLKGIQAGGDEVLERAVAWLREGH